ncbi:MAG TPA: chorismate mutase [Acidimicrobiales bacterium]|jgi:chorismate mutase|nr:chorismate mutase [Acidimicrobiales bacterium]
MPSSVRALRGATTVEEDTVREITERTIELLSRMLESNAVQLDDLISVLFTTTPDLAAMFPATAAREIGFGSIPLLCATEIDVIGATPRCIRVLVHLNTEQPRDALHHVYLHGARQLRDDLPV